MGKSQKTEQSIRRQSRSVPHGEPTFGHATGPTPSSEMTALARLLARQAARDAIQASNEMPVSRMNADDPSQVPEE